MSTNTVVRVAQAALTATTTTALTTVNAVTGTSGVNVLLKDVLVANTDSVARKVSLYVGTATGVATTVLPAVSVPANTAISININMLALSGETIYGGADAASVVGLTITGVKFV